MKQQFLTAMATTIIFFSCTTPAADNKSTKSAKSRDTVITTPAANADGYTTGRGEFYCEGNVAADGLGCMVKIDGVVYKMQRENTELFEESSMFDKAGKPVLVNIEYKKTGNRYKMMGGGDGPELILIRSVKPVE